MGEVKTAPPLSENDLLDVRAGIWICPVGWTGDGDADGHYRYTRDALLANIDALQSENARLREALRPFATLGTRLDDRFDKDRAMTFTSPVFLPSITVGDLRRAHEALADKL